MLSLSWRLLHRTLWFPSGRRSQSLEWTPPPTATSPSRGLSCIHPITFRHVWIYGPVWFMVVWTFLERMKWLFGPTGNRCNRQMTTMSSRVNGTNIPLWGKEKSTWYYPSSTSGFFLFWWFSTIGTSLKRWISSTELGMRCMHIIT